MQMASSDGTQSVNTTLSYSARDDTALSPDRFPVGSRIEVRFPEHGQWVSASVLKTHSQAAHLPRDASRGDILCHYDQDGVIKWATLQDVRPSCSSSPPPPLEATHVDDPFPAGSKIEVFWKEEKTWFSASVLVTRTRWHTLRKSKTLTREIFCDYDLDGHMQWHSLHNNKIRHRTGLFLGS